MPSYFDSVLARQLPLIDGESGLVQKVSVLERIHSTVIIIIIIIIIIIVIFLLLLWLITIKYNCFLQL